MLSSDSDASDDDDVNSIKINENYAARFEHNKRREELHRLKDKYGDAASDDDDDESVEEDDDAVLMTKPIEDRFLTLLPLLRKRHESVYQAKTPFFPSYKETRELANLESDESEREEEDNSDGEPRVRVASVKKKPVTLKDLERQMILEKAYKTEIDDDGDSDADIKSKQLTHVEEQEQLRKQFIEAARQVSDDDGEGDDELFSVKHKTPEQRQQEEQSLPKVRLPKVKGEASRILQEFWTKEAEDENEEFLRRYIINEGWVDKDKGGPTFDPLDIDQDEETLEQQEQYERQYNFRFEEEGADKVITYPRDVDSVRRKSDTRKQQRERKKEREEQLKREKQEELKRLKNLKKLEIAERLEQIRKAAGTERVPDFDIEEIEGEWDPDKWDAKMHSIFQDEQDDTSDAQQQPEHEPEADDEDEQAFDEEKPTWDDDIDISDIVPPAAVEEKSDDDDDDDETGLSAKQRKKKRRAKAFAEKHRALTTKQQGTAGEGASHVEPKELSKEEIDKILEEYYQLDYEDMIGDTPVRFPYKKVKPNSFRLSVADILSAEDRELNQYLSLKKLATYRAKDAKPRTKWEWIAKRGDLVREAKKRQREESEHKQPNKRAKHAEQPTLLEDDAEPDAVVDDEGKKNKKDKKKKQKKKQKHQQADDEEVEPDEEHHETNDGDDEEDADANTMRKSKKHKKHKKHQHHSESEPDDNETMQEEPEAAEEDEAEQQHQYRKKKSKKSKVVHSDDGNNDGDDDAAASKSKHKRHSES